MGSLRKPEHFDVAVVGGGIAGLYCCLQFPPEMRVALFEATGRIGGRIETTRMEGFDAEWGSMRFDPGRQPIMAKLIRDFGLETEPFPEYSSPPTSRPPAAFGLQKDERGLSTLELFAMGIRRVLNKSESELMSLTDEELEYFKRHGRYGNGPLWEQGLWNVFSDVLSYGALKYIMMDGSFFHGVHENPGVAGTMLTWVKMLQMSAHLMGIRGGMQSITDRMLEAVRAKGVTIHTGHTLQALSAHGRQVTLTSNAGVFTADEVILALPSHSLKAIRGFPEEIGKLLDSVFEYPLLKCFFVVEDPWWEEDVPNMGAETFPTRELHYYRQGGKGMVMVYADRPTMYTWRPYLKAEYHDRAEIGANDRLAIAFARRMRINPEAVSSYGIRDWTRAPYGAGVHLWKPGVEPWKVSEALEAFSLTGGSPRNVHICGEAFSDFQGFMEGAVRTAQNVMAKVLG